MFGTSLRRPGPVLGVVLLGGSLLLAGCGAGTSETTASDGADSGNTASPSTSADGTAAAETPSGTAPGRTGETALIVVVNDGAGQEVTYSLSCDPPQGEHPDPTGACAALANPKLLDPVPADTVCTAVFGGPQTATISGMFDGREVNATFDRTDGCQLTRWDEAQAVLGPTPPTP